MMRLFTADVNKILEYANSRSICLIEYPGTPLLEAVRKSCREYEGEVDPDAWSHIKKIKLLLRAGADASIPDENGVTALHYAAFYGKLKIVELLLKTPGGVGALELKGKMDPDDTSAEGQTPRDLALEKGHLEIVEYIDGKGWMEDDEEWKAAAAAEKEEDEMWNRALAKWGISDMKYINELGECGTTVLIDAVFGGNIEDVKQLLEAGADASVSTEEGITPLHYAAASGNVEMTKLILQTPGGPGIGGETMMRTTALHFAAMSGHAKVVELLLKTPGGVDALEIKALDQTPRDMALEGGYSEIVEYIDSKGWM
jgi:ankyrin repeat protein